MHRDDADEAARRALAAQLRVDAPALFGDPSAARAVAPAPVAPAPPAPSTYNLVNALFDIDAKRLTDKADAQRRTANPITLAEGRLAAMTPKLLVAEREMLAEALSIAASEIAAGREGINYVDEVNQWLDDAEQFFRT